MSRMAHDFFAASPLLALPVLSMLLFGAVFVAILAKTLRAGAETHQRASALPLEEDRHD